MAAGALLSKLFAEATKAQNRSLSSYSGRRIGAAILSTDKRIFVGANVENASYSLSICAERVAVMAAIMSGITEWEAIVVAFAEAPAGPPCGACLQFIAELCSRDLLIGWAVNDGELTTAYLGELLPKPFRC